MWYSFFIIEILKCLGAAFSYMCLNILVNINYLLVIAMLYRKKTDYSVFQHYLFAAKMNKFSGIQRALILKNT